MLVCRFDFFIHKGRVVEKYLVHKVPLKKEDNCAHIWKYVTKIGKLGTREGNWQQECNYFHENCKGSCSRVKVHLLRTPDIGIKMCLAV